MYRVAQKARPPHFTACNFRTIDQIGTKFGTNKRYFILNITLMFFMPPYKYKAVQMKHWIVHLINYLFLYKKVWH